MKNFLNKLKNFIFRLYQRSYGLDDLNKTLIIASLIVSIIASLTRISIISLISTVLFVIMLLRYFSTNKVARVEENRKFRRATKGIRLSWQYRKTHRIYKCKKCGQYIRVPKGQGKIETTCPSCGNKETHIS